jgi:hypothetical protein
MLFRQAFRNSSRTVGRRAKSTATFRDEGASSLSGNGALLAAVGTTFVTYMTADFLSNFIQHPTQQVSFSPFLTKKALLVPLLTLSVSDGLRLLQPIHWQACDQ